MYSVNEDIVRHSIKYLKKDLKDDWYCDPQNYKDIFSDISKLVAKINNKIIKGNGIYMADESFLFNIPKGNGGFRYTLEVCPIDRIAYHVFGIELIYLLDKTLPFNILGHRKSLDDETLFKPVIEQWNKFENYTRISGKEKFIIETDITNYYDSIEIGVLKKELINSASTARLSPDNFIRCHFFIESIYNILRSISFNGKKGLPQNRDISSFLANIYMKSLDKCLEGVVYYRYMDDIRIVANTRADANKYMLIVVGALREIGLAINSSKTRILDPDSENHKKYCAEIDLETKKIDVLVNSGKRKYVLESFHEIFPKVIRYIEEGNIYERKFRFYANRLIIFFNAKDVRVPAKYKKILSEKLIGGINSRPDCADQICALVQAIGSYKQLQDNLSEWVINKDNLTFEWAVYLVLRTLVSQGYKSRKLTDFCKGQFNDETSSIAIRGISSIYLNVRVTDEVIKKLAIENNFFLKRHYLISLSKCSRYKIKKNQFAIPLNEEILNDHSELYKLSGDKDFSFVRQSEKQSQRVLIKELCDYA